MDTLLLTTTASSETVATKKGKTVGDSPATGKVDRPPAAKRDRKAAPATKDAPVTVKDAQPTGAALTVTEDVPVTVKDPEPTVEEPTVTTDVPVTGKDTENAAQEPTVSSCDKIT